MTLKGNRRIELTGMIIADGINVRDELGISCEVCSFSNTPKCHYDIPCAASNTVKHPSHFVELKDL